jgi:hypothetical protein
LTTHDAQLLRSSGVDQNQCVQKRLSGSPTSAKNSAFWIRLCNGGLTRSLQDRANVRSPSILRYCLLKGRRHQIYQVMKKMAMNNVEDDYLLIVHHILSQLSAIAKCAYPKGFIASMPAAPTVAMPELHHQHLPLALGEGRHAVVLVGYKH